MKTQTTHATTKKQSLLPVIFLLILSLVWGSSFILIKKSLQVFTFEQVGAGRIFFGFLALGFLAITRAKQIPKAQWKYVLAMGLLGNLFPAFLFAIAITQVPSSVTGILNALTPLFTFLIGMVFFKAKMQKGQLWGLLLGFVGCVGLSLVNSNGQLGQLNYFLLFVVIACLCYATSANIIKTHLSTIHPVTLTACAMILIGPLAATYLFSSDFVERIQTHPDAWFSLSCLIFLGTVGTGYALILFNRLVQTVSPVFATSVTYIIPIIAVMWGVLDQEQLFPLHFIGMALIIAGVYVVNKFRNVA
ncbi:EamA family transporter [Rapidithrix thailandica]|uniref:EamA family transporter n=1 Tax=Rapidithrix thailandica TaxID=413964 RepID=A0AAW9S1C5_9BACT